MATAALGTPNIATDKDDSKEECANEESDDRCLRQDAEINDREEPVVVPCTNFSIDEILKPGFGKQKINAFVHSVNHFSAFKPVSGHRPYVGDNFMFMDTQNLVLKETIPVNRPRSLSPLSSSSGPGSPGTISSPNISSPESEKQLWPAWVYCTRYSDRPSAGNSSYMSFWKKNIENFSYKRKGV